MFDFSGGCKCKNITFYAKSIKGIGELSHRICDCDFCVSYDAQYVSDPNGFLSIEFANTDKVVRVRQGSGIAIFLVCKECDVLVSALYDDGEKIYGAINFSAANDYAGFGQKVCISPKQLGKNEKIERWSKLWFPNVVIK